MREILDQRFLSNTTYDWLFVAAVIAFVSLFSKGLSIFIMKLLHQLFKNRWKPEFTMQLQESLLNPLRRFIIVFTAAISLGNLVFPQAFKFNLFGYHSQGFVPKIGLLIVLISFFSLMFSIVNFITGRIAAKARTTAGRTDDQLVFFFRDLLKVFVVSIAILTILQMVFNKDIKVLLRGLTIVGAAVALAAKESLENLIASFIIFFDKPFKVGDLVKLTNATGTVERVGLRSTRLRTVERTLVTIPNKQMVDNIIENQTVKTQHRTELRFEFVTATPEESIKAFIEKTKALLDSNANILSFNVFFLDLSKNAIVVLVEYFLPVAPLYQLREINQKVNFALKDIITGLKMEMNSSSSTVNIIQQQEPPKPDTII